MYIPATYHDGDEAAVLFQADDGVDPIQEVIGPQSGPPTFRLLAVTADRMTSPGAVPSVRVPFIVIATNNADNRDIETATMSALYAECVTERRFDPSTPCRSTCRPNCLAAALVTHALTTPDCSALPPKHHAPCHYFVPW